METIKPFEVTVNNNAPDTPQVWRVFVDREFSAKLRIIKKDANTKRTVWKLKCRGVWKNKCLIYGKVLAGYKISPTRFLLMDFELSLL